MDLSTNYLGLRLKHPIMPGASPLAHDLGSVKQLEDAGAAAIVLPSLFEEQIRREAIDTELAAEMSEASSAEALRMFPAPEEFRLGPEPYLEHVRKVKEAVSVPVIASLNGVTGSGWLDYAKQIEKAGADALELNVYFLAADPNEPGETVEKRTVDIAREVKKGVKIPVAVKMSPFYSSIANMARQLDEVGVDGLVLFNRFYQPDIDIEELEVVPALHLSDSSELLLRIRWIAMLAGRTKGSLAASGGVHTPADAIKAIMAGANAVQLVSALLRRGPAYLGTLLQQVTEWMEKEGYESMDQMRGNMSHQRTPDPAALERANYARIITGWRPDATV